MSARSREEDKERAVGLWRRRGKPKISEAVRQVCLGCQHCYWYGSQGRLREVKVGDRQHHRSRYWLRCYYRRPCPLQPFQNISSPACYERMKAVGRVCLEGRSPKMPAKKMPAKKMPAKKMPAKKRGDYPKKGEPPKPGWAHGLSYRTRRILVDVLGAQTIDDVRELVASGKFRDSRGVGTRSWGEVMDLLEQCD